MGGIYQWKQRGEKHIFNPDTIHLLQQSTQKNDYSIFKKYSKLIDDQTAKAITLRGLLKFKKGTPVPIDEVEPNGEFAKPQQIPIRATIDGTVRGEDVDYFAVDLTAGQSISVELEGLRHSIDSGMFDPSLVIFDAERFQVAEVA